MNRREFIGGAAVAWPLAAGAQQRDRVRRIGMLLSGDETDPEVKLRYSAFTQALADLGWTDGRNVRIDLRWHGGDSNRIRALAQELVGLQPDVILANGTPGTVLLQRETRTIPIVFANVGDPVASGIVARLDRPSGNITGFANYEATLGGKWLELLSEIAPGLKRAAIIFNPDLPPLSSFMPSFEMAARPAPSLPAAGGRSKGLLSIAVHSALIPNSFIIGHHFSASAFTSAASASGVCRSRGKISIPRSPSRERTVGWASASTAAALSLPTMSLGVRLGAKSPNHSE
jgi:hypothetical protein